MLDGEEGFVPSSPKVRNCGEAVASSGGVDLGDLKAAAAAPATTTELAPPSAALSSGGETMSESEAENPQEQQRQRRRGVKFLCSFGGSILPRPFDGKLRYVGGETRIVRVSRDISFAELVLKMAEFYDQPFTIKYQLPEEEDLDALVSVLSNDDLGNMMEEYDKLEATDGFTRLRLFLFSAAEQLDVSSVCAEADAVDQRFVDALNWLSIPEPRRSESYNSLNSPDGGSIARRIARQQEVIHVASPPLSPMSHPRQPSSPFSHHQIDDSGDVQQQQQQQPPWTLGSHLRMQDLMSPRSCPFQEPMPKYKHSMKVFPSNEGYCGNSPEYESPRELNRIEGANQWPEANNNNNQPFGPDISGHVHQNIHYQNMQSVHLVQQQHQHQHQGYCVSDVYPNPEVVSPGRKIPVPPVNYGIVCETLEQSDAQHHHRRHHPSHPYPPENYEGEKPWHHHVSPYHASPHHPETADYEFSSLKLPQGIPIAHGEGLGRNLIHHAASTNDLDRFAEGQKHLQGVWPHDCGVLEAAKYENRLDYVGKAHFEPLNSLGFGGRNIEQNENLGLTGHNMSQMHGRFQRSVSALEYQQERQIAYEARYAAIYRENSQYYQDQHGPNRLEQQIHNPHSVSKEGLPIQHGPNRVEQQIHNPHSVSKEGLPVQNAGRKVDHRLLPSLDQVQTDTGHLDRVDRARAWVLHSTNYHRDTTQRPVETPGVLTAEDGILKDAIGQNCYSEHNLRSVKPDVSYHDPTSSDFYKHPTCDRYESSALMPQFEPSAHKPHNLQRLMIDSHLDNDSVFHQGFGGGQSHWCCERKNRDSACVQKNHTSYNTNSDDIHNYARTHVPDEYMHKEIAHISNYGGAVPKEFHQDPSSEMAQVIQGVSSMIVSSHYQTDRQSEVLGEQISDAFTNSEGNGTISDNACPHIRAPLRVFLPDSSLTLSSSLEVLSSSLSSDGPPIYDRSPESSIKITAPKDLLSENGVGLINKSNPERKDFGREQLTEKFVSKMEVARDENLEKGTRENSLNDRSEVDASRLSSAIKSQEQGSIVISSTTILEGNLASTASVLISSTTNIEKQVSTASAKGGDCNEVEQEAFTPGSNVKDGSQEEKPPQDNKKRSINGSVNMEKNNASLSEADALAQGLQTIRNNDLEEVRELGSGTYGTVYYGKWKGSDVAIKRIKTSCFTGNQSEQDKMIADFWKEACMLSQLHHPNVVAFYGVVRDGPDGTLATVTEYMVNGSLKQVLHKKDRTIDRRKRLIIARDVAFGMEYLHSKNIVHFDMKCDNLLVNMKDPHRPICKIGDLGLSKIKQRTLVSGGVRGTLPWMAPELLSGESGMVTEKVDVYSFGIVMWELLTGEEPYANMHCGEIIGGILNNTLRPAIPDWCREPAWRSLMERCWSHDPGQRPSFSEIATELRAMGESMNVK